MKKKLLILSACIGLILACFPFTLCAEEDPQSDLGISTPPAIPQLDSYFYDNYTSLPYIEAEGSQYIDTGVSSRSGLDIKLGLGGLSTNSSNTNTIIGSSSSGIQIVYLYNSESYYIRFNSQTNTYQSSFDPYSIYSLRLDDNLAYVNGNLIKTFNEATFNNNNSMYLFANHASGGQAGDFGSFKLYSCSIYDYNANNGEGEYIRYYYPARAKSGGTIGLYDAVSKTFVTTGGSSPFENPTGSDAEMSISAKITTFIVSSLSWIGDILGFAISEPLIICFMAIGLAGAMFRWGRRLVHF